MRWQKDRAGLLDGLCSQWPMAHGSSTTLDYGLLWRE